MQTLTADVTQSPFRLRLIAELNSGIRTQQKFEELSNNILTNISNELLLVSNFNERKEVLEQLKKQIDEAQIIRRFNMMHESPNHNKQLKAALSHLSNQFNLRYAKYFY